VDLVRAVEADGGTYPWRPAATATLKIYRAVCRTMLRMVASYPSRSRTSSCRQCTIPSGPPQARFRSQGGAAQRQSLLRLTPWIVECTLTRHTACSWLQLSSDTVRTRWNHQSFVIEDQRHVVINCNQTSSSGCGKTRTVWTAKRRHAIDPPRSVLTRGTVRGGHCVT